MDVFSILTITRALKSIEEVLLHEAICEASKHNHEPTRKFFSKSIDETFGNNHSEEIIEKMHSIWKGLQNEH